MSEMVDRVADAIALASRVLARHSSDPDDEVSFLAREFLRAMEERVWRDISTAPRHGTVLVCDKDDPEQVFSVHWEDLDQRFPWVGSDEWYSPDRFTHWQPLPPPPEETPDV